MQIKNKLIYGATLLGLLPALVAGVVISWIAIDSGRATLESEAQQRLVAIRDGKQGEIERYFQTIQDQVLTFSNDRMIIEAMGDFKRAFSVYREETQPNIAFQKQQLARYYNQDFANEYKKHNNNKLPNIASMLGGLDADGVALQYTYIKANTNPLGSKDALIDPKDNSSYAKSHALYHPHIRDYLSRFGYYDIFLVDIQSGDIVYSVFKELDFTTSLHDGPYAESGIGQAFKRALQGQDTTHVALTDFAEYVPSYRAPASFIASPIYDGAKKVGVLIFQMPVDRINEIMTYNGKWKASGLGDSGETYLVGSDYTMRSMSRFLVEDKDAYLQALIAGGTHADVAEEINAHDTSIGLQEVRTVGSEAALSGEKGFEIFDDYRGVPVLSAFSPVDIMGLRWAIMSEIDESEAFSAADTLATTVLTAVVIILLLVVAVAVAAGWLFSGTITRPLNRTVAMIRDIGQGDGDLTQRLDENSKDEFGELAKGFNQFVSKLQNIVSDIDSSVSALNSSAGDLANVTEHSNRTTQEQQSQTEQISTAISEMAASVNEVARHAVEAAQSATTADSEADTGRLVVDNTIDNITQLANEVDKATEVVQSLANESDKIGTVLDVIRDIAEQTNLLALNAAIEAARAGEQGRGFAVVADEVRSLASRTQESTEEIQNMIHRLQSGTSTAVTVMEAGRELSHVSADKAREAGGALEKITQAISLINNMNTQIASAAEEQSVVAEEISQNVRHVKELSDSSATDASQIAKNSEDLARVAGHLQGVVAQFKF